jgi:glycine/D-amino acid oxidase-like deaminating enzyme
MAMPTLRLARPLWLAQAGKAPRFPALDRAATVDIAVVGGGITGISVAWMFASKGLRVGLVESQRIGRGSTAASTALLMQEPDSDLGELAARYGGRRARRIWRLSRSATRGMIGTLRDLDIRCRLREVDSIYYAVRRDSARSLRREHRRRQAAGLAATWLDAGALARATGIDGAGAIRMRGNGQVDPYRACIGLARSARQNKARLFERSPVVRIDPTRDGITVHTRAGRLHADQVVIATGYATAICNRLNARIRLMNTYVAATRPIRSRERRLLGLGDVMLWDTSHPYHYARWTSDHRLLIGGGDRPRVFGPRRLLAFREGVAAIRRHFERLLPGLAAIDIDFAWEGLFATTPDGLPYIGPHAEYPRHLFALGYGGNGMTFGFLAARLLLDRVQGVRSVDQELLGFKRHRA